MPRFYFHLHDHVSSLDQDGIEIPDLETVQAEAVYLVGSLLQEQGRRFSPVSPLAVDVIDGDGVRVLRVEVGLIHRGSSNAQNSRSLEAFLK
ncbi:MAG: DUF6894 family protein [Janthinobacterium lividum]